MTIIRTMQKVIIQTCPDRFRLYYGSIEDLPDRKCPLILPHKESHPLELEVKNLAPTNWPARATRFESHEQDEVIITLDQPVVIVVKNWAADAAEAFLIGPYTKVTIQAGILHGWVLALSGEAKIIVVYPREKEEYFYKDKYLLVLPTELGVEQGEIPAYIW